LFAYVWQHLMNPRIVGRLQHDAGLRSVHLVNAEWPC
jgi:hypothetical protein